MGRTLDVYLHRALAGHLIQDDDGRLIFHYAEGWLANPAAMPLSHSLPLRQQPFSQRECRGYFAGILPEEDKRELVARNLGISARNDFSMLERIGGECAGAVTFIRAGENLPDPGLFRRRPLSGKELAEILQALPRRPLLAGEEDVRLSLAGVQDKIAVVVEGDQIAIPLSGTPSTHILKPASPYFEGLVFNEAFCMKLAAAIGLPAARVDICSVRRIDYLLIERYDRRKRLPLPDALPLTQEAPTPRLHQEDFCQALGIPPENKYQNEGGPSLKDCFALVRAVSSTPVVDLQRLLDAVIFNFLAGNHDAHGKNFSILYDEGAARLAPLYDVVCTLCYPELSNKMAMKIGGEYRSDLVLSGHFERLAEESGLARPLVKNRIAELAGSMLAGLNEIAVPRRVPERMPVLISERCEAAMKFK